MEFYVPSFEIEKRHRRALLFFFIVNWNVTQLLQLFQWIVCGINYIRAEWPFDSRSSIFIFFVRSLIAVQLLIGKLHFFFKNNWIFAETCSINGQRSCSFRILLNVILYGHSVSSSSSLSWLDVFFRFVLISKRIEFDFDWKPNRELNVRPKQNEKKKQTNADRSFYSFFLAFSDAASIQTE